MRVILACAVSWLALAFASPGTAEASKAIPWTMKGCVFDGQLYAVDGDSAALVRFRKPYYVKPFEGKHIELKGLLFPGDHFLPDDARAKVRGPCSRTAKKAVLYARAWELRMRAGEAHAAGKLDEAARLLAASMKVVTPVDCDTYIDRAQLATDTGDLGAAASDVKILQAKKCRLRKRLNWLLLQELGNALRAKGAKQTAIAALELARASCDADLCRDDIAKDLAAAKQ